ncbi:hypothetical protein INT44_006104 [Umbelopsis vinacea]|uniref:Transmembrane protein n=1 Tax=Umbelopsis vinacea TaxID=44442 RepID=A0A8H7PZI0_9FUNG|nr:hypothetical protein INT44_006104 [Umbelopsis vinacea]
MARDSSTTSSCSVALVPLVFVVVWSLGISRYDHRTLEDKAMQYGVGQLVINAVLLISAMSGCGEVMVALVGIVALLGMIANAVLLGLGFGWFKILTGYTIFEMYSQLGHNYWLSLPLLQGAMYFNLWFSLVLCCISAAMLAIGIVVWMCTTSTLCITSLVRKKEYSDA